MSFYLEIKASLLKDVVKAIENINAESIWVFDHEGIYIRMSDVYRYKMLEININHRDTVNFKFDSPKPYYLGLVIDRLKDVTKTLKSSDLLIMDYSDGNSFITAESNGLKRNIKLIDISLIGQPPELLVSQEYQSVIESKKMSSFLKAISKSISFDVIIIEGNFIIRSETDEGLAEISWSEGDCNLDTELSESVTNFSTAEITKALVACKNNLVIKGSDDSPISFEWELAPNSTIKSLVAPRV
ncbi:MAG: hypothetical protein HOE36_07575 [Flavobacteriaceae bacterium]|jgi:hypothetical protein|nr:hypothetical protein [Flavobacteriaceae bacterium]